MMPYQSYQQWAIERSLTLTEQRAADRRRGEAAASVSRSLRRLRPRVRRPAAYPAVHVHAPAAGGGNGPASPGTVSLQAEVWC
jgi:hypothetical protein